MLNKAELVGGFSARNRYVSTKSFPGNLWEINIYLWCFGSNPVFHSYARISENVAVSGFNICRNIFQRHFGAE